jgi:FkbM family methyltransferase
MIFDFQKIVNKVGVTGVIHVGGFVGEELDEYRRCGLYNTFIFEPQPNLYNKILAKIEVGESVSNLAVGDKEGTAEMYISWREGGTERGSGASSSLLKPFKHLTEHPEVEFREKITVDVITLDSCLSYFEGLNFLNVDVQGYELKVLQGAEKTLEQISGLIIEVNRDEVYKGCAKIWEIDEFLEKRGFERTEVTWQSESWGDALYEKT